MEARGRSYRNEFVAVVLVVFVIVGLGAGYIVGIGSRQTITSTSYLVSSAATTVTQTSTFVPACCRVTTSIVTVTSRVTYTAANSTVTLGPPYAATSLETFNVTLGTPRVVGVDENLHRIYVGSASDNLAVVDEYTHDLVSTITLPAVAQVVAADYETHMVFVDAGGAVVEINGTTDKAVGTLPEQMQTFAYDPVNHVIYGAVNDSLVGLNVMTGSVVANVSLGMFADSVAVDWDTNMVVAAGCHLEGLVCNDSALVVNGTNDSLVATVQIGGGFYPLVAAGMNSHHLFYVVNGGLMALNETNGNVVFDVPQQECDPFDSIAFVQTEDQIAAVSFEDNYTFVYDGLTGALLNMYSLPAAPVDIAYNPLSNEIYVTMSSQLMAFTDSAGPGHYDIALVDHGGNCPLP